jgi:hypothetical protein
MWNGETFRIHYFVTKDGNVQVDVPRALVDKFNSSVAPLDSLKSIQKLNRAERSFDLVSLISIV